MTSRFRSDQNMGGKMEQIAEIAKRLHLQQNQIQNTLTLLQEGNTVPFIARYRKEMTKGLDEEQIRLIQEVYDYEIKINKRKEDVLRLIETQGKLTDEIIKQVNACVKLSEIEDIYRPYQQKKKTRATEAVSKGLEPFAKWILTLPQVTSPEEEASKFLSDKVQNIEEALQGAMDIIAEIVSSDTELRKRVRLSMSEYGSIKTSVKKNHSDEQKTYQMYYDFTDKTKYIAPHRIMAIERAEKEKVIKVRIDFDQERHLEWTKRKYTKGKHSPCNKYLDAAIEDGCKRLLFPSVENEVRSELIAEAHEKSIDIFSLNVEKLLLQTPMKNKMILGLDPAFRTGCKLALIDSTGKLINIDVIYPHAPVNKIKEASEKILYYLTNYPIDIIAIGNGTASRESEQFIAELINKNHLTCSYTIVSEAGASVYSASELAKKEFPDLQVEQRSAVSIARRILDPLAELIKINPKSIGVGQYQHDLPNARLSERLDFVVSKVVNRVGVNVNTASQELLSNISGLSKTTAKEIIRVRENEGQFKNRTQLKEVKGIGTKSYEQSIGFLRIEDGNNPLDRTSIHPESYDLALRILQQNQIEKNEIGSPKCFEIMSSLHLAEVVSQFNHDRYTIEDIMKSLMEPLRDYRDECVGPLLRKDILSLEDLVRGMELEGVVRNVVDFGAFIDIGLKNDGLAHISKMRKERIKHPSDVVQVGDIIKVWIDAIDHERGKVQLSLIAD